MGDRHPLLHSTPSDRDPPAGTGDYHPLPDSAPPPSHGAAAATGTYRTDKGAAAVTGGSVPPTDKGAAAVMGGSVPPTDKGAEAAAVGFQPLPDSPNPPADPDVAAAASDFHKLYHATTTVIHEKAHREALVGRIGCSVKGAVWVGLGVAMIWYSTTIPDECTLERLPRIYAGMGVVVLVYGLLNFMNAANAGNFARVGENAVLSLKYTEEAREEEAQAAVAKATQAAKPVVALSCAYCCLSMGAFNTYLVLYLWGRHMLRLDHSGCGDKDLDVFNNVAFFEFIVYCCLGEVVKRLLGCILGKPPSPEPTPVVVAAPVPVAAVV